MGAARGLACLTLMDKQPTALLGFLRAKTSLAQGELAARAERRLGPTAYSLLDLIGSLLQCATVMRFSWLALETCLN